MNDKKILNPTTNPDDALTILMETVKNVPLPMEANTLIRISEKTLRDFIVSHTGDKCIDISELPDEKQLEPEVKPQDELSNTDN